MGENMKTTDHFIFDGCDTVELAKKYGTPLYVISNTNILERCREIRDAFLNKYENTRAVYASKAFLTQEMCRIMTREGLGLDVVSGGELYTAQKAGVPMGNIIFHGNNKSLDEIEMAVNYGVGRIVVDNHYELEMINKIAEKHNKVMDILFRITPGIDSHTHKFISTGQLDSKFGIAIQEGILRNHVKDAMNMPFVNLKGFHFHVGSQLSNNASHLMALDILLNLMKEMKDELNFVTKEINLGGGFGIRYTDEDERKELAYFMDPMMDKIYAKCKDYSLEIPQVIIEPGRLIIGEAGITLYTIGSIKEVPGIRTYVSVDGGMPDNPRPALYDAKYEAVVANKLSQPRNMTATISGKCCESGDILIWDLKVPQVEPGDILAVLSTGAYNYSMSSNYNKLPRPAIVMVEDGRDRLVMRRETYDDLLSREV